MLKRSWAALDSLCPTDDEGGISEFERCLCTGQDRARAAFYGLIKRGDECAVRTETKTFTFITRRWIDKMILPILTLNTLKEASVSIVA